MVVLIGMIYNKKYDKSYDIRSMAHVLSQLDLQLYREDIDEFIELLKKIIDNDIWKSITKIDDVLKAKKQKSKNRKIRPKINQNIGDDFRIITIEIACWLIRQNDGGIIDER